MNEQEQEEENKNCSVAMLQYRAELSDMKELLRNLLECQSWYEYHIIGETGIVEVTCLSCGLKGLGSTDNVQHAVTCAYKKALMSLKPYR